VVTSNDAPHVISDSRTTEREVVLQGVVDPRHRHCECFLCKTLATKLWQEWSKLFRETA
jgi:hypothetical protein